MDTMIVAAIAAPSANTTHARECLLARVGGANKPRVIEYATDRFHSRGNDIMQLHEKAADSCFHCDLRMRWVPSTGFGCK